MTFIPRMPVSRLQFWPALVVAGLLFAVPVSRLQAHGVYHELLDRLTARLAAEPERTDLWFKRASVYLEHGDWQEALADLDQTEKLAPGKFPTSALGGRALAAGKNFVEALAAFDRALAAIPADAATRMARARLLGEMGRAGEAANEAARAVAAMTTPEPDDVMEWVDLLVQSGRKKEALAALDASMVQMGPLPVFVRRAVSLHQEQGNLDHALACIEQAEAAAPRKEPWMALRAQTIEQSGRTAEALAAWQTLRVHLEALPAPERDSQAMIRHAEQTHQAISRISKPAETTQHPTLHPAL